MTSVLLHVLLIGLIIIGSLVSVVKLGGEGKEGTVIDAVMVDPGVIVEQYNQMQQQEKSAEQAVKDRKEKEQKQDAELKKTQEQEQKRLQKLQQESIQSEPEAQEKQKKSTDTAKKVKEEQKIAEEATAKAKAEKEAEAAKAKEKAEADAKAKAAKNASFVDDLLGDLTESRPSKQGGAAAASQGGGKKSGASNADLDSYAGKVKAAIQSKFYDSDTFRGRTCELQLKIAPDGLLISITPTNNPANDPALCDAAIRAAKLSKLPKPATDVYQAFKKQGSTVVFNPK